MTIDQIEQWVIFHAAPGTSYVNHFFPRELIIWFKSIQAKQVDLETSSLARSLRERGRLASLEKRGVYLSHVKPLKSPQPSLLDWSILSFSRQTGFPSTCIGLLNNPSIRRSNHGDKYSISKFRVCRQNLVVWPCKWNVSSGTFTWHYLSSF